MGRRVLAALAIAPLVACAGLLGVDDASYDDGTDAAPPDDVASPPPPDEHASPPPQPDAPAETEAGDARADVDAATSYRDLILSARPLAYWRMSPVLGKIADETGRGNALVLSGGVTVQKVGAIAGDRDPAATFDGMSGRADPAGSAAFAMIGDSAVQPFTIEAWVRYAPSACGAACAFPTILGYISGDPPGPREGYFLYGVSAEGGAKLPNITGEIELFDAGQICANTFITSTWMHVVYVYDGTLNVYIDDKLVPCTFAHPPHGLTLRTTLLQVGYHAGDGFFPGDLDELAIYERALTTLEVGAHHRRGLGQ